MLSYKKWNGVDSINGASANRVAESFGTKNLWLFYNEYDVVERIEQIKVLRSVYNISEQEFPTEESVCAEYLRLLDAEKQAQEEARQQAETSAQENNDRMQNIESNLEYLVMMSE